MNVGWILEVYALLLGCKELIYIWMLYSILCIEVGWVTFMSTQYDPFIKRVKWVGLCQPTSLTGQVRVEEL